jgi:HK97 family phage major capsid protein
MPPTIEDLSKKMGETHDKVLETHDALKKADAQIVALELAGKNVPEGLKETLAQVQTAMTKSDEAHTAIQTKFTEMEAKLSSLNIKEMECKADEVAHSDAFFQMMRKGIKSVEHEQLLDDLQQKTMYAASDPDGGYAIPRPTVDRIVKDITESSPVRQFATIVTIGGEEYKYLIDIDDNGAGWVSERASRPKTDTAQIQMGNIPAHEMYANPFVTQKQLDDAAFDIEGWLNGKVATKFGRLEASAFVLGDGAGKPRGFMTYAAGSSWGQIEQVNSGSATAVTADGLILLQNALKAEYAASAVFCMRRSTVGQIRLLKSHDSQYIWQPGLQAGEPATLLGDPVVRMADMPAIGSGTTPIAYGNLAETYTIVDRLAIRILRDPYSNKPYVEFYTTKRVGGDVTNFESLKIQILAT